ncbi:MAG: YebC/PmpR family DNA-binding transcriptional regulator [Deltaproteobacteria bacterium]|nr:YebC/PmpR family DNA-binding transcriptional regulator [Deltaproteobacteria bacterium]
MGAQWKQKHREHAAAAKGRIFTKLAKEIAIAAKDGADPSMNARLRMAIEAAKKASMTRETLERAIKKGAGLRDGSVQYDTVTYEGFAPHQVPVVVECLTDNKNRTATNVRVIFHKGKGQLAASGAVSWDFDRLGCVEAIHGGDVDFEEEAIEAGAQDLEAQDPEDDDGEAGSAIFYTDPTDLDVVRTALEGRAWTVSSAKLIYKAKNPLTLDDAAAAQVEAFLEALDDDDDVQNLYVGMA